VGAATFGPFLIGGWGPLHSSAQRGEHLVHFDGVLTHGREAGKTDAEVALDAFEARGLEGLKALEGFFNVVAVVRDEARAVVVSDPLATRPLYLYEGDGVVAVASEAAFFARTGRTMTPDRLGIYEMFRLQHPVGPRTMIAELTRSRPFTSYEVTVTEDGGGAIRHLTTWPIVLDIDETLDVDSAARRIHDISAEVMRGLLSHPLLADLPIHLPLTAGMDSRHILGDLDEQGRLPRSIRHVRLNEAEVRPVRLMAQAFEVPLYEVALEDLDLAEVIGRWVRRTAGMVSFHQAYLLGVEPGETSEPVMGFDGYLADRFYGFKAEAQAPADRHYTQLAVLAKLFAEHEALDAGCRADMQAQDEHFVGTAYFKQGATDATNRGVSYTGAIFPMLSDTAVYFAPGAHARAFDFFRTTSEAVAGVKRARLRLFQNHFRRLGGFIDEYGHTYLEQETFPLKSKGRLKPALRFLGGVLTGGRRDYAPDTEHAWLRQIPLLRRLHSRVTEDCRLARDGLLDGDTVRDLWQRHLRGGYHAWPLMSVATAEVAYRLLVLGEDVEEVVSWLVEAD